MPYTIQEQDGRIALELKGGVTARDVGEMAKALASTLKSGASVVVQTHELEDIDTCVLQLLVSLHKTAATLSIENPSEVFVDALDRCALKREILPGSKESL